MPANKRAEKVAAYAAAKGISISELLEVTETGNEREKIMNFDEISEEEINAIMEKNLKGIPEWMRKEPMIFKPIKMFRTRVNEIGWESPMYIYAESYNECNEMANYFETRDNTRKSPVIIDNPDNEDWAYEVLANSLRMARARGYKK